MIPSAVAWYLELTELAALTALGVGVGLGLTGNGLDASTRGGLGLCLTGAELTSNGTGLAAAGLDVPGAGPGPGLGLAEAEMDDVGCGLATVGGELEGDDLSDRTKTMNPSLQVCKHYLDPIPTLAVFNNGLPLNQVRDTHT